jgi:hypothetical protein
LPVLSRQSVANIAFDLGLPVTDSGMLNNADTKLAARLLRVGGSLPTGLEEWNSKKTAWLDDLREVRNQATHRHLVHLVEIKSWDQQPPPPGPGKWTSDVVIDVRPGDSRPLIDFVATNYDTVLGLLKSSLDRLLVVLKLVGR